MQKNTTRFVTLALLLASATAAQAHTGHATSSLMEGLLHPVSGLDHLLAMLAVGLWSASALPAGKTWMGPATFLAALAASAGLGMLGVSVPQLELLVALSVVLFGAMLVIPSQALPTMAGLALVSLAAGLHGLAHGAEAPASGWAPYTAGFLFTTAGLHFVGVACGQGVRAFLARQARWVMAASGAFLGGAGLYLVTQL